MPANIYTAFYPLEEVDGLPKFSPEMHSKSFDIEELEKKARKLSSTHYYSDDIIYSGTEVPCATHEKYLLSASNLEQRFIGFRIASGEGLYQTYRYHSAKNSKENHMIFLPIFPVNAAGQLLEPQTLLDTLGSKERKWGGVDSLIGTWKNKVVAPIDSVQAGYKAIVCLNHNIELAKISKYKFQVQTPTEFLHSVFCFAELPSIFASEITQELATKQKTCFAHFTNLSTEQAQEYICESPVVYQLKDMVVKEFLKLQSKGYRARIKEIKALQENGGCKELEELALQKAVGRTSHLLETLQLLQMHKSVIETVVGGITKNTLSEASVAALRKSMWEMRNSQTTILNGLKKHLVTKTKK